MVLVGRAKNNLNTQVKATTKTYKREDMCGFPADSIIAFRDPGFIHDGLLTDLQPATLYFYSFGSPKVCQISV